LSDGGFETTRSCEGITYSKTFTVVPSFRFRFDRMMASRCPGLDSTFLIPRLVPIIVLAAAA
jgi:hypothetical protein